jgi:hypothetical protein
MFLKKAPCRGAWFFNPKYAKVRVLERYGIMTEELVCWQCGASIADQPLPLARLAACAACRCDLHVCRLCLFYDRRVARECREPVAEAVQDKERANFCGYFQPRAGAYVRRDAAAAETARARLEALFGEDNESDGSRAAAAGPSETEAARERLEQLFKGKDGGGRHERN